MPFDAPSPTAQRGLGGRLYDAFTLGMAQIIGLSNPARAMSYIQGRNALLSYAAGSRRGASKRWNPKNTTADDLIRKDWHRVTARARDLVRNSGHVSGALQKIVNNVVSDCGIRPQVQLRDGADKLDRKRNRAVEAIWKRWAEHPRVNFREAQELVLRHNWVDGENIIHLYESPDLYRQGVVPLGIELLEADHLDSSVNGLLANGNKAVRGIEFDAAGFPVAYHLFTEHPGASMSSTRSFSLGTSVRVDAARIIHPFLRTRASQTRGISWLAPVIMEMYDFAEYQNSERVAARLTSAFAFFITSAYPELSPGLLGGQLPGSTPPTALEGAKLPDYVDPGRIQALPHGTKVQAEGFQRPGSAYADFTKTSLKGASAGFNMSYEAYANDYSEAAYSAARSAALEERRSFKQQQAFLVEKFCTPLWGTWCQFLALSGFGEQIGLGPLAGSAIPVIWQTPGWPWVDPQKDAKAAQLRHELGTTSRRRIAAEQGEDLDEIMEERREEQQLYGDLVTPVTKAKETPNAPQEG